MSKWSYISIGEIADVFDGPHATPQTIDTGPIFLGISSLNNGRLNLSDTRHVSEEDFRKWTRRVTPKERDIVFSYETRLGQAAILPKGLKCCLGRRMGLVRIDPNKYDAKFFLYYYLSPNFQSFLQKHTINGATVDRIALKEFPSFLIPKVELKKQRTIANVLSALDDKIELNRRINETLEGMAQAIFRDWFVDFGPVRRKRDGLRDPVKIMGGLLPDPAKAAPLTNLFPDSFNDIGLPEGWEKGELSHFIKIKHGYAFKGEYFRKETMPNILVTPGNFRIGGGFKPDKFKYYDGPIDKEYILKKK